MECANYSQRYLPGTTFFCSFRNGCFIALYRYAISTLVVHRWDVRRASIIVKIIGLYFVAAVMLFFVFYEQSQTASKETNNLKRDRFYPSTLLMGLVAVAFLLAGMILRGPTTRGLVYFLVPPCALMVMLASREFSALSERSSNRMRHFLTFFYRLRLEQPSLFCVFAPIPCFRAVRHLSVAFSFYLPRGTT